MITQILTAEQIPWLLQLDNEILLAVNRLHSPYFDTFMMMVSNKWIWLPMYVALLYMVWRVFSKRTALLYLLAVVLLVTLSDQLSAALIKPLAERLRPACLLNPIHPLVHIVDGYRGGRFGFPSSHSANCWAVTFFIYFTFRNRYQLGFMSLWSLLVCYSRMYLGVHYLGDLLGGFVLGTLVAAVVYAALKHVWPWHFDLPQRYVLKFHVLLVPVVVGVFTLMCIAIASAYIRL